MRSPSSGISEPVAHEQKGKEAICRTCWVEGVTIRGYGEFALIGFIAPENGLLKCDDSNCKVNW